jgi:hypothetical protein
LLQLAFPVSLLLASVGAVPLPDGDASDTFDDGSKSSPPDLGAARTTASGSTVEGIAPAPRGPSAVGLPAPTASPPAGATATTSTDPEPAVPSPSRHRYFFHGYDYGSQAIFNPITSFLNRGFDVLQIRGEARDPFDVHADDARNVFDNLAHPFARIGDEGAWKFTREEILPLSWSQDTMRWAPNYTLHLIGGGMTYTAMREWYEDHGVPWPGLFSAVTMMSSALMNETLENKGVRGRNTDCIADIYFFDLGGILLFSFAPINRFFSETIVVSDWSLQPGFTWPGTALNNQGNYFALKWSLPFYPALRAFAYLGLGSLLGLSYRLPSGLSLSLGGGLRSTRLINQSQASLENNVDLAASAGLFVDRNESLLGSLVVSNITDYFVSLNLYPNAILRFEPGIGLWSAISKNGHVVVGLSIARALGLGAGWGSVYR